MSAPAHLAAAPPAAAPMRAARRRARGEDRWPNTTRLMPWTLAAFLVMLWLVPFDRTLAPIPSPVDPTLDRVLIPAIAVLWLIAVVLRGPGAPTLRPTKVGTALVVFIVLAVASVAVNSDQLARLGELDEAVKKLALLLSYAAFFYIVATTIRPAEAQAFCALMVFLACLTALGVIYEYRTLHNIFYDWTAQLLPGSFAVGAPPPVRPWERPPIVGPASHGLATTLMFATALPFAMTAALDRKRWGDRLLYGVAIALICAASFATQRKSALVLPVIALVVMFAYRPREMTRLLPLGGVVVVLMMVMAPGALAGVKSQYVRGIFAQNSTKDRASDYDAVAPDVLSHLALGRGFGTYDPKTYRYLDNQYLMLAVEVGLIGLAAFLIVIGAVLATAHGPIRSRHPLRAPPALAAAAGAAAFGAGAFLFDVLAFPQAPYLFMFVAGLAVACSVEERRRTVRCSAMAAGTGKDDRT